MARYRVIPPRIADLRQAPGNGETVVDPPARQTRAELQSVLDEAHDAGILEEPADATEAAAQGVTAAAIDTVDGEQVLVETVEPKKRKSAPKKKAAK